MRFPKPVLTALALLLSYFSFAQPICGFDQVHGRRMSTDSVYRNKIRHYESGLRITAQQYLNRPKQSHVLSGPYTIPVVVHVVHTGGAIGSIYNPTDTQIQDAIAYLNAVYNGSYPGTQGVGDLEIQFVLAQRDPNCNPTNGINRIDGSGVAGYLNGGVNAQTGLGTDDINIKNLIRWDPSQYYNIWVVNKIDGNDGTSGSFIAGFAYFPGGDPSLDGTVMLATQMRTGQKTLPHEIGHAFSLYHPFQGSSGNTCPANADCTTDGDQICDTDPITAPSNFACRTGDPNPCMGGNPYNIYTESNYMNYTDCYTLFTPGQKARMLASAASPERISLSNSMGGMPTTAGTTCLPKINFELDGDQLSEATASSAGCRSYQDYTYNMVIGNSPSVTATATLNIVSATATEGLDFDITTNGDFTSPSKTLNFPAGSAASRPFTVRIYDDASVEAKEAFTLGFTVNNGGGNAVAGDGKSNLTIGISDNDTVPQTGNSTAVANIGAVLGSINATPFDARQQRQRAQFLYKASELSAAGAKPGNLSAISLNIQDKLTIRPFSGLTIKLGKASVNYLINGSATQGSSMTIVKSLASYATVAGWNDFVFDTPYNWDGTSSLVLELCFDNGTSSSSDTTDWIQVYSDGGTSSQSNAFFRNGINCSQSFSTISYYQSGIKPVIKLSYSIPPTAVQTALNSSKQEYLGPNSDIYFYDQANNKLMARIQNLSSFDYGCTQVIIDRAGGGASPFWNNNSSNYLMDKTFRVLPANNNASGSYAITLYYTQAEVNGWVATTAQSISNIQLVKTSNAISAVTPGNPAAGGSIVTGIPVISTLGTNTGLTYNFTTGFSGFGAGVVGISLPIDLLDFYGVLNNDHASLLWSTSFEENSKGFDIERSYDGGSFVKIGYVAAAGSSSVKKDYAFTDPDGAHENNYYRLRQIDLNDKYEYSKVLSLKATTATYFKVLNNPFSNYVGLQFGKPVTGRIQARLLDITGKELLRVNNETPGLTNMRIDLSHKNLSAGVYLLEVLLNNEKHIERVIKQ